MKATIIKDAINLAKTADYQQILQNKHYDRLMLYRVDSLDLSVTPIVPFTSYVLAESEEGAASQAQRTSDSIPTKSEKKVLAYATNVTRVDEFLMRGWGEKNLNGEIA